MIGQRKANRRPASRRSARPPVVHRLALDLVDAGGAAGGGTRLAAAAAVGAVELELDAVAHRRLDGLGVDDAEGELAALGPGPGRVVDPVVEDAGRLDDEVGDVAAARRLA